MLENGGNQLPSFFFNFAAMKKRPVIRFFVLLILLASMGSIFPGCGAEADCEQGMVNRVRMAFWTRSIATGRLQQVQVDSITVFGINAQDTLIYDNRRRLRSIELPLEPLADSTGFVLQFPGNQKDTIWIKHGHQFHLLSPECGFTVFFNITGVSHTTRTISHFSIIQPFVSNTLEEHISLVINPFTGN